MGPARDFPRPHPGAGDGRRCTVAPVVFFGGKQKYGKQKAEMGGDRRGWFLLSAFCFLLWLWLCMTEAQEGLIDGLKAMECGLGCSLNWAGEDYPCAGGAVTGGRSLGIGGFLVEADVRIVVRKCVFSEGTGVPKEKQTIEYKDGPVSDGRRLRIESITPIMGVALLLGCNDPSKGA